MATGIKLIQNIDSDSWKEFKIWCIENDVKLGDKISNLIKSFLKKEKKKEQKKERKGKK